MLSTFQANGKTEKENEWRSRFNSSGIEIKRKNRYKEEIETNKDSERKILLTSKVSKKFQVKLQD